MLSKAKIRRLSLNKRRQIPSSRQREMSKEACRRAMDIPGVKEADILMAYAPIRDEMDPFPLIEAWWRKQGTVVFPSVEDGRICPRRVDRRDQLVPGAFGVPEPTPKQEAVPPQAIDVIIVPGVAFDERGARIGYGAGYYDRFLPQTKWTAVRIGLTYSCCLFQELPLEPHDAIMDWIVAEHRVFGPFR